MKSKKLLFNNLILKYNKCISKLKGLSERGLNFRKQAILGKRLERIKQQLLSLQYAFKKATVAISFAGGLALFQSNTVNAQNFQPALINPFSLDSVINGSNALASADYADIDADGDIDILVYSGSLDALAIIKNEGIPGTPEFKIGRAHV